jgi:hypothetical protein
MVVVVGLTVVLLPLITVPLMLRLVAPVTLHASWLPWPAEMTVGAAVKAAITGADGCVPLLELPPPLQAESKRIIIGRNSRCEMLCLISCTEFFNCDLLMQSLISGCNAVRVPGFGSSLTSLVRS